MPCFYPQKAYKTTDGKVTFVRKSGTSNLTLSCGRCTGCRLERARQWGVRCMHESSMHQDNCFITLTYSDEQLPNNESINVKHFQKFIKRLRKSVAPKKIRYLHCGEYGEQSRRPHYHAIIFNHDFEDKILCRNDPKMPLWTSETLDTLWGYGFTNIGNVTFASASYVAKYILKKITGDTAPDHYSHITRYGELVALTPEYLTMSRRPGIGYTWWQQFKNEVYPCDYITFNGHKQKPPKYYRRFLESEEPEKFKIVRQQDRRQARRNKQDRTHERLMVIEQCTNAKIQSRKL